MLRLYFLMDEFKLSQKFEVIEYEDYDGSLMFRVAMNVKVGNEIANSICLVDIKDRDQAYSFADRLNKNWDDIYEIPRWVKMFTKTYMTEKGLDNAGA